MTLDKEKLAKCLIINGYGHTTIRDIERLVNQFNDLKEESELFLINASKYGMHIAWTTYKSRSRNAEILATRKELLKLKNDD